MADIANSIYNNKSANPKPISNIAGTQQTQSSGSGIIKTAVTATDNIANSKKSAGTPKGQGGVLEDTAPIKAVFDNFMTNIGELQTTMLAFGDSINIFSESGSSFVDGLTKTTNIFGQATETLSSVNIPETVNFTGSVQTEHKFNGAEAANNLINTLGPEMKQQTNEQLNSAFNKVNRGVGPLDAGLFGPDTRQIMGGTQV